MAWHLLTASPGLWHRAGMSGHISGFDFAAATARAVARECDTEALEYLLAAGEAGALEALLEAAKNDA